MAGGRLSSSVHIPLRAPLEEFHRHDDALAVGLDLPSPPAGARFSFAGHAVALSEGTGRAQQLASTASAGTCSGKTPADLAGVGLVCAGPCGLAGLI